MTGADPSEPARRLAAASLASDDATGWFERLYAAAADGDAVVPWDSGAPHRLLIEWTRGIDGRGRSALVVGCGLGDDAEHIARLGFDTLAFDVSPTAVRSARERFPDSAARYVVADLLDPPDAWGEGFDLVVEILTVQSLPDPPRRAAIAQVGRMVAPGGTLIVIATARDEQDGPVAGPPWPLTRAEVEAFAGAGLATVRIEHVRDAGQPGLGRWRAEFCRRSRV